MTARPNSRWARRVAPPKEVSLHFSVAAFIRVAWPEDLPWTHFPAGEVRDERTGAKLKAMGLGAGWPDFQFVMPNGQASFLELKRPNTRIHMSDAQIEVRQKLIGCGCGYSVCQSVDEVARTLERWLSLYGRKLRARTMIQGTLL